MKSLCPRQALSCKFPQRRESRLCAAEGLPTCESPGPGGWGCKPWGCRPLGAEGRRGPLPCCCPQGGGDDPCSGTQQEWGCWGILGQLDAAGCCCAGRKALAPWSSPLGIVGGWCPPGAWRLGCLPAGRDACPLLPESAEGSSVSHPLAVVPTAPSSRWSSQRFPSPCRGSAALLACLEVSLQPSQQGRSSSPAISQPCSEGRVAPLACLGGQLPRSQIAGIPAEQALLSVADPTLLLFPAGPAQLPLPLHPAGAANGTDLVTSARPGTDPFPGGSPTMFCNPQLCPDPSFGPDQYRAFLGPLPLLGVGGMTHSLLPPLPAGSVAPPCPLSLPPYRPLLAAGPLPYKVRCRASLLASPQVTPLFGGRLSQPSSLALGAAGEVDQVAIPLPVQPVGHDGRR